MLVGGIRAVWLYGRPPWLRNALLILSVAGVTTAGLAAFIHGAPTWLVLVGAGLGIGPLSLWIMARAMLYTGPPPGLVRGPKQLDLVDKALDSLGSLIGLDRRDKADDDET